MDKEKSLSYSRRMAGSPGENLWIIPSGRTIGRKLFVIEHKINLGDLLPQELAVIINFDDSKPGLHKSMFRKENVSQLKYGTLLHVYDHN